MASPPASSTSAPPRSRRPTPRGTASKARVGGAEERAARKAVSRIEKRLARITVEETAINAEILEHAQDYERLGELSARLTALATEKDELELEWLDASELLE